MVPCTVSDESSSMRCGKGRLTKRRSSAKVEMNCQRVLVVKGWLLVVLEIDCSNLYGKMVMA